MRSTDEPTGGERRVVRRLGVPRNATKAAVVLIERDGELVVRKGMPEGRDGLAYRLGRYLVRREAAVLRQLEHTGLVPVLLDSGEDWFETRYVPGETVSCHRRSGFSPNVAALLRAAVARLHAAGYAHGDLGRRDMILTPEGGVVIVDFATGVGRSSPPLLGPLLRAWFRRSDRARIERTIRRGLARSTSAGAADAPRAVTLAVAAEPSRQQS